MLERRYRCFYNHPLCFQNDAGIVECTLGFTMIAVVSAMVLAFSSADTVLFIMILAFSTADTVVFTMIPAFMRADTVVIALSSMFSL